MWQWLASEPEVFVHLGFVYAPLLFDADIEAEVAALGAQKAPPTSREVQTISDTVIFADGKYFIKSVSLDSLAANYPVVFPEAYEQQRAALRREIFLGNTPYQAPLNAKLKTIIFEILPHFVRTQRGWRQPRGKAAILAHLAGTISRPAEAGVLVARLRERRRTLQEVCRRLEERPSAPGPPPEIHRLDGKLTEWLHRAVLAHLAAQERSYWGRELAEVEELLHLPEPQLAALLIVADQEGWEVDGFGCRRDPKYPGDYVVYRRTGEYLLKDYFGRLYLFPDCRVGVATAGPFYPMVLDTYKHPLLRRFDSRQRICLTDYQPAIEFSADGVIRALEEGLNALFHGYNSRKRNGYNSLDTFGRHQSVVDFDDWRLSRDDPRLAGGDLEVKNSSY